MAANKNASISESVYELLYKNIVNLTLTPGTAISEKEIAEKLNVSRTPVREAFIKLSREALVNILPQKGTIISRIDLARVQEERFLRESLECSVVDLYVNTHDSASLKRLYELIDQQKESLHNHDITGFLNYDDLFHKTMFEETKKLLCYNLIKSFSSHYQRIRYLSLKFEDISVNVLTQHENLLDAVKKKDSAEARIIMREHIKKLNFEKKEILNKYPDFFMEEEKSIKDFTF